MLRATKMTAIGKKRKQLEEHLEANGWRQDRFGHWKKVGGLAAETLFRFKMGSISCRYEKQIKICGKNEWRSMRPDKTQYYKNFLVTEDNLISFSGE